MTQCKLHTTRQLQGGGQFTRFTHTDKSLIKDKGRHVYTTTSIHQSTTTLHERHYKLKHMCYADVLLVCSLYLYPYHIKYEWDLSLYSQSKGTPLVIKHPQRRLEASN